MKGNTKHQKWRKAQKLSRTPFIYINIHIIKLASHDSMELLILMTTYEKFRLLGTGDGIAKFLLKILPASWYRDGSVHVTLDSEALAKAINLPRRALGMRKCALEPSTSSVQS